MRLPKWCTHRMLVTTLRFTRSIQGWMSLSKKCEPLGSEPALLMNNPTSREPTASHVFSNASGADRSMAADTHSTSYFERISSASSSRTCVRRAMMTQLTPLAATRLVNALPVPSEAPAITAHGPYLCLKSGAIFLTRLLDQMPLG